MDKKVAIGAAFHWRSFLHIGSHQYAKQFARNGYKVAYISEPISPLHYLFAKNRTVLKEKYNSWRSGGEWVEGGRIWSYVPFTLLPAYYKPILRSQWVIEHSHQFSFPRVDTMLKKNGFTEVDIVFLDEAFSYLLDLVKHKKSILRIHDDISYLFNKGSENFLKKEKEVIQKVDLVIVVSRLLEVAAKEMGAKKVMYLPNGAEFEHFYFGNDVLPEEYQNIPRPRVIYVGSINYWFDADLVAYVANKLSKISFIFIGDPMINLTKIASLPNVYILGKRDRDVLPQYLRNADVGVIPWKRGQFTDYAHPNKLYEYMACGLPVVSTRWKELEYIKSPAYLASNHEEFVELLLEASGEKDRRKYIEFAKANSWEHRFEALMKAVDSDTGA